MRINAALKKTPSVGIVDFSVESKYEMKIEMNLLLQDSDLGISYATDELYRVIIISPERWG